MDNEACARTSSPRGLADPVNPLVQVFINQSSSDVDATDRSPLPRLPTELLDQIFWAVHRDTLADDDSSYGVGPLPAHAHAPLGRRLYPSQQRALYHRVRIDSLGDIERSCYAVEASADVGPLVRELRLWPGWDPLVRRDRHA